MSKALLLLCACIGTLAAAEDTSIGSEGTSIGVWNHQLLVTAPASGTSDLPGGTQRLTVDWRDTTLAEAADFLRHATLLNVVVMPGCETHRLLLTVTDMPLAAMVRWMSTQTGLAWAYSQQALVFSDKPLARASVTRLYDVSDLAAQVRDFPGPEMAFSSAGAGKGSFAPVQENNQPQSVEEIGEFLRRQLHLE